MTDTMHEAFPLQWPIGWPRTERRQRAAFSTTLGRARDELRHELRLLGARNIVISTNAPLRKDGDFYASATRIDDPAVAVYFTLGGEQRCIPCDKWDRLQDNIRALTLTIGALRGLDRWGAKEMVNAAFMGFQALPASSEAGWWVTLGVDRSADTDDIKAAYRRRVIETHPDKGGDAAEFQRVQDAYTEANRERLA